MTQTETLTYNRTFQAANDKVYDDVCMFVEKLAHHQRFSDGYFYQFLDKDETKVVRRDPYKMIIELSDKVGSFVENSIRNITKTEIRVSDLITR